MTRLRGTTRSVIHGISAFVLMPTVLVVTVDVAASTTPPSLSPPSPASTDWQHYVPAPLTNDVRPTRVVRTSGSVSGARNLTGSPAHHGTTVLTMVAGGPHPIVVVDYGKDVGGVPYFAMKSESGSPALSASYSEGLQYLGPEGDGSPSLSDAGNSSRVDNLIASSPGLLSTDLIQGGGERYERVSLVTPGTVTLSGLGIRFTAVRATAKDYKGWFVSSSNELNRIWFDGAYTIQLDELPANAVSGPWNIIDGVLNGSGGAGILRNGARWTNYTMTFDTQVVDKQAGWLVRASSSAAGYLFLLDDSSGSAGTGGTLHEIALGTKTTAVIANVPLARSITAGPWYRIKTVVSGADVTTSIDGQEVSQFSTDSLSNGAPVYRSGSVGFLLPGTAANIRKLEVVTPAGTVLFSNNLSAPTALADFTGPDLRIPDPLPIIVDGAKRDREDWSGDLSVSAANVFYTTDAAAYVRQSLWLLGSYQDANGEFAGQVYPTSNAGKFPNNAATYSASYSMQEVDNIATYYLYTGDLAFVRSEWPMIVRELAYDRSLVDGRGLLATDATNGRDWDYYDGAKPGEVTAYNDIYYETLKDASVLAKALGENSQAITFNQETKALRSAINQYLFDPRTELYGLSNLQPGVIAQDANSLAVDYGVAPTGSDGAILRALDQALPQVPFGPLPYSSNSGYQMAVSPFVTDQQVQASFEAGDTTQAMATLQTVWGHMIAPGPDNTSADWELVAANGAPGFGAFTSLAHGWSSGATADLSAFVLGVQPSSAGYRSWLVQPHPGSLSWVDGDVPTPRGTIAVRWAQNRAKRQFVLLVSAPRGTKGVISVPVATTGSVVTVRSTRFGTTRQSVQSFTTASGASYFPIAATGGRTYHLEVTPRSNTAS